MGTLCCWAAVGAEAGPEAGPELSRGGRESCSVVLQGEKTVYKMRKMKKK